MCLFIVFKLSKSNLICVNSSIMSILVIHSDVLYWITQLYLENIYGRLSVGYMKSLMLCYECRSAILIIFSSLLA
jgi:hypothetical protein